MKYVIAFALLLPMSLRPFYGQSDEVEEEFMKIFETDYYSILSEKFPLPKNKYDFLNRTSAFMNKFYHNEDFEKILVGKKFWSNFHGEVRNNETIDTIRKIDEYFLLAEKGLIKSLERRMANLEELKNLNRLKMVLGQNQSVLDKVIKYANLYGQVKKGAADMPKDVRAQEWERLWSSIVQLAEPIEDSKKRLNAYLDYWRLYQKINLKSSPTYQERIGYHSNKQDILKQLVGAVDKIPEFGIDQTSLDIVELKDQHAQNAYEYTIHDAVESAVQLGEALKNPTLEELKGVQAAIKRALPDPFQLEDALARRARVFQYIPDDEPNALKQAIATKFTHTLIRQAARRALKVHWDREIEALLSKGESKSLARLHSLVPAYEGYIRSEHAQAGCINALHAYFEAAERDISCVQIERLSSVDRCGTYAGRWSLPTARDLKEVYANSLDQKFAKYFVFGRLGRPSQFSWTEDWSVIQNQLQSAENCGVDFSRVELKSRYRLLKDYKEASSAESKKQAAQKIWDESKKLARAWNVQEPVDPKQEYWANRLNEMKSRFDQLAASHESPEMLRDKWGAFLERFGEDNPFTREDNDLIAKATNKIGIYIDEIKKAEEAASVSAAEETAESDQPSMAPEADPDAQPAGAPEIRPAEANSGPSERHDWGRLPYFEKVRRLWQMVMAAKSTSQAESLLIQQGPELGLKVDSQTTGSRVLNSIYSGANVETPGRENQVVFMTAEMHGKIENFERQISLLGKLSATKEAIAIDTIEGKKNHSYNDIIEYIKNMRYLGILFLTFKKSSARKRDIVLLEYINEAIDEIGGQEWREREPEKILQKFTENIVFTRLQSEQAIKAQYILAYFYKINNSLDHAIDHYFEVLKLMANTGIDVFELNINKKARMYEKEHVELKLCECLDAIQRKDYNKVLDSKNTEIYNFANSLCNNRELQVLGEKNIIEMNFLELFQLIDGFTRNQQLPLKHENKRKAILKILDEDFSARILLQHKANYPFLPKNLSVNSVQMLRTYWQFSPEVPKNTMQNLYNDLKNEKEKKALRKVFRNYLKDLP